MTEKDLQRSVIHAARALGWRDAWTWRSFHSPKGWPDLFLARGLHLVVAELKAERGKVTPDQETWLAWWRNYGAAVDYAVEGNGLLVAHQVPLVDVFVWRPADLERIYWFLVTGEWAAAKGERSEAVG